MDEYQAALDRYADALGYDLDGDQRASFAESFAAFDETLAALSAFEPPDPPDRAYWDPTDETDPNGAFLTRCDVRGAPDGPLAGTTIGVKDNVAVAGVSMTCGSPAMADCVPTEDATVVRRLLAAGGRIVGKTNLDEFAYGRRPGSMRIRTAKNPHDPEYQPGSSSTGSGVAVADGLVDAALGTDNGGSIRYPAAWCSVVGLKPSRGLVSHHGFVQSAKTLDTIGVLARESRGVAAVLAAIAGPDPRDDATTGADVGEYVAAAKRGASTAPADLTVGVPESFFGQAPDLDEYVRAAVESLADRGATVRQVTIDGIEYARPAYTALNLTETGNYFRANATNYWHVTASDPAIPASVHEALTERTASLSDRILLLTLYAAYLSSEGGDRYYTLGHRARRHVASGIDAAFEEVDVLASTTVPVTPPRLDEPLPVEAASNTLPANVSGHPAVSVPCGCHEGLPVGLQFVAPRFEEATALRAAAHWEAIRDN
jgi:Asp-tRNA(Asn)/Glu-tRNA(Gln) amidotransferase A subunit family amidase